MNVFLKILLKELSVAVFSKLAEVISKFTIENEPAKEKTVQTDTNSTCLGSSQETEKQ